MSTIYIRLNRTSSMHHKVSCNSAILSFHPSRMHIKLEFPFGLSSFQSLHLYHMTHLMFQIVQYFTAFWHNFNLSFELGGTLCKKCNFFLFIYRISCWVILSNPEIVSHYSKIYLVEVYAMGLL